MTFQLVHDDQLREFEFFAPKGWPYWVEQAHEQDGRRGLPLVIALHGGAQDPARRRTPLALGDDVHSARSAERGFKSAPPG